MRPTTHRKFTVLESVRCLDCSKIYSKPCGGGTVWANPGCPHCGYVGWLPITTPFSEGRRRARSVVGRRLPQLARSG